jgi:hypothetical protein
MRTPRNPFPVILAFLVAFWLGRNHAAPYIHMLLSSIGHLLEHL